MTVLIDANIVLDVLLLREPWLADSRRVWAACDQGRLSGFLSAVSFANIFYLGRKVVGTDEAFVVLRTCMASFRVADINEITIAAALSMPGRDFEDNLQIASAMQLKVDRIVTRDMNGFLHSPILALTPSSLLAELDRAV